MPKTSDRVAIGGGGGGGITFDGTISNNQLAIRSGAATIGGFGAFAGAIPYMSVDGITPVSNIFFNRSPITGFFGVGIAAPLYPLDVVGATRFNGDLGFFNTTPTTQQVGGAATAGAAYGATEQTMLQTVYDALRAYGLLT